jgi:hypothetical protein
MWSTQAVQQPHQGVFQSSSVSPEAWAGRPVALQRAAAPAARMKVRREMGFMGGLLSGSQDRPSSGGKRKGKVDATPFAAPPMDPGFRRGDMLI